MKKLIQTITLSILAFTAMGQECTVQDEPNYNGNEAECRQGISLYTEFLKQENYKDAAQNWWNAQKVCPQYKPLLYDNGTYIYKQLAKAVTDKNSDAFKNKMDTLEMIYGLWEKNFGECYEIHFQKAHDAMTDETKRYNKAYKSFEEGFKTAPIEKIESYDVVYYFRAAYFMVSGKLIDCARMMEIYTELGEIATKKVEQYKAAGDTEKLQDWLNTQQTLESYITPCASCDVLIEIYKPQTTDAPDNIELAKTVVEKLDKLDCEDPYVLELVERIDAVEPTATSKMQLGNAYYSKKDYSKALDFYEEAINRDDIDAATKDKTILKMAKIYLNRSSYKSAYKYAGMLSGCEAKFIQAQAVAQSAGKCAENKTQRTAIYSYALDIADAAGSCASSSWKAKLKQQLSTTTDLFSEGIKKGESVAVPCWNTKVKIRVQ